jgi:hypothetical protein
VMSSILMLGNLLLCVSAAGNFKILEMKGHSNAEGKT